jgi:hypothetical protein
MPKTRTKRETPTLDSLAHDIEEIHHILDKLIAIHQSHGHTFDEGAGGVENLSESAQTEIREAHKAEDKETDASR